MAEPRIEIGGEDNEVEMTVAVDAATAPDGEADGDVGNGEQEAPAMKSQEGTFINYLKSPIVELVVGKGEDQTVLRAHQAILMESPFFAEAIAQLRDSGPRRLTLEDESLDAVGCFLQYQYTGEYFPRRLSSPSDGLESDPSIPETDDSGAQLLKHARVYTLAEKLGLRNLKILAHAKIHRINSTARGEITYARFVYANTRPDDATIRKPVAAFWATRSHVLRHEAEDEFRAMCLEHPQFGFDVLSLVLDQKEKRSHDREAESPVVKASARKRARVAL